MPGVSFPLDERWLPTVVLTRQETAEYRAAASEIVSRTLDQEIDFRYRRKGRLEDDKWKFVKAKDRVKVFKRLPLTVNSSASLSTASRLPAGADGSAKSTPGHRRMNSSGGQEATPMVVAIGKIDGLMEDALYGVHHKTTEEMRITTSFLNKHHLDAAVLHTIDQGTDADPFRYLGIKWRVAETPGGSLISNRDVCVLEYVGTGTDPLGYKYGFHVIKSIDVPWFPEFPDPRIVRARMMLCCIYRQLEPNAVDCYMKGVFNLGGELLDMIAYNTAADTLLGIAKTVDCAEAKKLTLRMIMEQRRRAKSFQRLGGSRAGSTRRPRSAWSFTGTEVVSVDRTATSVTASDEEDERDDRFDDDDDVCSVCHKSRSVLSKLGSSWDRCRICRGAVCSKCHVRKTVFARPRHIKVPCCKVCIMAARELAVDPRDPYPVIGNMVLDSR